MKITIHLTDERKLKVYEDLSHGSNPQGAFFLLVAVSTLIAAFGLVMDSTAVVIGAMLVAPLMTPILGLALALVRGDPHLLGLAVRSEVLGVMVSILAGALLGMALPLHFEATPEMLARTTPNLLDLLVAILAGLAGAYALVNERLSPVLPGVAISTAIVPPLANSGMCLSLGAYNGALGSFLLFFTNFLSILLVSAFVFYLAGMGEELRLRSGLTIARRFGVAVAGLVIVGVLLSSELITMFENRRLRIEMMQALQNELATLRVSDMERLLYQKEDDTLLVLVDVNAPSVVEPRTVQDVQNRLEQVVGKPVELFIRTTVTHDVSASGSIHQTVAETLDGFFLSAEPDQRIRTLQTAEQVVREYLDEKLGIHLESLEAYPVATQMLLVAEIAGARHLNRQEIEELERLIQDRLAQVPIRLLVRQESANLRDKLGSVRTEFDMPRNSSSEEQITIDSIMEFARSWLSDKKYWLNSLSCTILEDVYHVLLEVKGPTLFTRDDLHALRRDLAEVVDVSVEIYVRSELEAVVGPQGYTSFEELLNHYLERNRTAYPDEMRQLILEGR